MKAHSWVVKALLQKAVCSAGLLPLYYAGQRTFGRLNNWHPARRIEYAAKLWLDTADLVPLADATVVEIGTGWVPVVPLGLHLMGAGRIVTFDLNRHFQAELTLRSVPLLRDCIGEIQRRTGLDPAPLHARLDRLMTADSPETLLRLAGIEYRAPADASRSGLPSGSVDLVYSNLVLEHIPESALRAIHAESRRILKPEGVAWHNVDYSDHYAATNRHVSATNFLRYSARFWSAVGNNDILWQNRLRKSQHQALLAASGLTQLRCVDHGIEGWPAAQQRVPALHDDWAATTDEDLRTTSSRFVVRAAR